MAHGLGLVLGVVAPGHGKGRVKVRVRCVSPGPLRMAPSPLWGMSGVWVNFSCPILGGHGGLGVRWPLECCPSVVTHPPGVGKGERCKGCTYAPGRGSVFGGPLIRTQLGGLYPGVWGGGTYGVGRWPRVELNSPREAPGGSSKDWAS